MNLNQLENSPSILVVKGNASKKQIAFTYDSGFEDSETDEVLKVLKKHNVKCTFFLTGVWAIKFDKLTKRIALEGHEIGNHSFNHPDMRHISCEEIIKNIKDGDEAIKSIIGKKPELFRLPFGHWNYEVLKAVGKAGYRQNIYWTIDTIDWQLPPVQSIVNRILKKADNGSIVLMHIAGNNTAEATDKAIENLKARGFTFTTVSEILK